MLDDLLSTNEDLYGSGDFFLTIVISFMIVGGHIVVMNVFTALAVGDVASIQATAYDKSSLSMIKFILYGMESWIFPKRYEYRL